VQDASGNPVANVVVRFQVIGSVNTSSSATTDANGKATFCYVGPALPGADTITAFADTDNNNVQDSTEPSGVAEKTWALPASYPVLVHRLAPLLHASFRPRLTTTPLRFANSSLPSG